MGSTGGALEVAVKHQEGLLLDACVPRSVQLALLDQ